MITERKLKTLQKTGLAGGQPDRRRWGTIHSHLCALRRREPDLTEPGTLGLGWDLVVPGPLEALTPSTCGRPW